MKTPGEWIDARRDEHARGATSTPTEWIAAIQSDARADLESLLRETEHMHLRTEENRPWLNRRNVALGWPPEK